LRIEDIVAGVGGIVLMELNTFYVLFAAAMIAAAKSPEMKESFNNKLLIQTKGVIVNPEILIQTTGCCAYHLN